MLSPFDTECAFVHILFITLQKKETKGQKHLFKNARGGKFKQYEQGCFKIKLFLVSFIQVFGAGNFPKIIYLLSRLKIDE